MRVQSVVFLSAGLTCAAFAAGAETLKYEPTAGVPTFAVREPVLRIKPGTIVETRTFSRPGDYYEGGAGRARSDRFTSKARRPATRSSSGS